MTKHFKRIFLPLVTGMAVSAQAALFDVAVWDFNTYDAEASTGTLLPSVGSGQVNPVGGTLLEFGFASGSSEAGPDNSALRLVAPSGASMGDLIGADFTISTLGYAQIQLRFDRLRPAGSPQTFHVEYSYDAGGTWLEYGTFGPSGSTWGVDTEGSWSNSTLLDLSADTAADNHPGLRFRVQTSLVNDVATDETILELDRVITFVDTPTPVPEPTALAVGLALGALAAGRRLGRR